MRSSKARLICFFMLIWSGVPSSALSADETDKPFLAFTGSSWALEAGIYPWVKICCIEVNRKLGECLTDTEISWRFEQICGDKRPYYKTVGKMSGGKCGYYLFSAICVPKSDQSSFEPFLAYYGREWMYFMRAQGDKEEGDDRMPLPNHIGCPQDTGLPVEEALQNLCVGGQVKIKSIGQSPGSTCGYNVISGVCVRQ
jgi:hypothetical protein